METTLTPSRKQLELSLAEAALSQAPRRGTPPASEPRARRTPHRPRRFAVSRWWFARMREAVQVAQDWPTSEADAVGAEQSALSLTSTPTRWARHRIA